jgi:hypothetical protein
MIRIQKIQIHEFRGIRDLTLDLGGENFAVCGPNGTGKSGVVDAIEFALTGNISRLSGRGTGELSVKDHGPHVDSRSKPEQAFVALTFKIVPLNKEATITRTVKAPSKPTIAPDDADVKAAIEHMAQHPEFVLSRRELIQYVLAEPSKRSEEVQALLRLEKIEALRGTLQKICNAHTKGVKPLENARNVAKESLLTALGIAKWSAPEVLVEVNKRRVILGLPELKEIEKDTSFKDGLATAEGNETASRVPKAQALKDIEALQKLLDGLKEKTFIESRAVILKDLTDLNADADSLGKLTHESLLQSALKLYDDEHCPVCDMEWKPEEFKAIVNQKLQKLAAVKEKKEKLENRILPIAASLEGLATSLGTVAKYGPLFTTQIDVQAFKDGAKALTDSAKQLRAFLPLADTTEVFEGDVCDIAAIEAKLGEINKATTEIPEPSLQVAARDYLVEGQVRLENFRTQSRQLETCKAAAEHSAKVLEKYGEVVTAELNDIYKNVETAFRNLYRIINQDDESKFEAQLTPSMGKLGFGVDFYGRGFFPPGAYHSEGHQDGMGLCLYLALMEHLLGKNFTFAVLDDVLMSVDCAHRREVCSLLKQKFPDTQFIMTTHDDIWLRHMQSAGLVKKNTGFAHFRTWSVDLGPTEWNGRDVWKEIEADLSKNDVRAAASLLRHYLEYFSKEACHRLRAQVVFRGDAQFTLGDLMPPGVSRLKNLLKDGKKAADSWGQTDKKIQIEALDTAIDEAKKETDLDQWQINGSVHYNEQWASLNKNDFQPVASGFKKLTALFECQKCNELLYVVPDRGDKEALRCGCGDLNINLVTKS